MQDKHEIDTFVNPITTLENINNWLTLTKEEKQKLISKYIDNVVIKKQGDKIEIVDGNFRQDYIKENMYNHDHYGIPFNLDFFVDDYGYRLPMNHEIKTESESKKYFEKLCNTLGNDYRLSYYTVDTDDDLKDTVIEVENNLEKIIRLIPIKNKNKNLRLGVITVDLSNVKDKDGKQVYIEIFNMLEKEQQELRNKVKEDNEKLENELCNI